MRVQGSAAMKNENEKRRYLTNKNLEDKIIVIQFTGSLCSVCRREMPELEKKVWQRFKNDDFILIGVDTKEPEEKVNEFIEKIGVTYPIGYDPDGKIFQISQLKELE